MLGLRNRGCLFNGRKCARGARYGNRMHRLPGAVLGLPSLRALWLEANPLDDAGDLRPSSEEAHHLSLGPALKNVGLDQFQAGRFCSPFPTPRLAATSLAHLCAPAPSAFFFGSCMFGMQQSLMFPCSDYRHALLRGP